jgi:hypothetical protein
VWTEGGVPTPRGRRDEEGEPRKDEPRKDEPRKDEPRKDEITKKRVAESGG